MAEVWEHYNQQKLCELTEKARDVLNECKIISLHLRTLGGGWGWSSDTPLVPRRGMNLLMRYSYGLLKCIPAKKRWLIFILYYTTYM